MGIRSGTGTLFSGYFEPVNLKTLRDEVGRLVAFA
jgi:hypothetical protein